MPRTPTDPLGLLRHYRPPRYEHGDITWMAPAIAAQRASIDDAAHPPIVATVYSDRLAKWVTVYLRAAPPGGWALTADSHNGLPVASQIGGGPLSTIGPEALSAMGLREAVPHPDADGN